MAGTARRPTPVARTIAADLAIRDVRVFDGRTAIEHRTVLVAGNRVVAVGAATELAIAPQARRSSTARGATLLPGLIDAHAHVNQESDAHAALSFGVTTEIDMYSSPEGSIALAQKDAFDRARVVPAGYGATAPGGHGTEYGVPVPTLTTPAEAEAFVTARAYEGSHHIKIILETGKELGFHIPSLDLATATALVTAAHAHKLLAIAHVGDAEDVGEALAAGVDGLAHLVPEPLDAATIAEIAAHHVFVVPTLTVLSSICGEKPGAALAKDPRIAERCSTRSAAHSLKTPFPPLPDAHLTCDAPAAAVARAPRRGRAPARRHRRRESRHRARRERARRARAPGRRRASSPSEALAAATSGARGGVRAPRPRRDPAGRDRGSRPRRRRSDARHHADARAARRVARRPPGRSRRATRGRDRRARSGHRGLGDPARPARRLRSRRRRRALRGEQRLDPGRHVDLEDRDHRAEPHRRRRPRDGRHRHRRRAARASAAGPASP